MEFLYGLITGCVLTVVGYLFRNKISTKAQNEVDALKDQMKSPKTSQPPTTKP